MGKRDANQLAVQLHKALADKTIDGRPMTQDELAENIDRSVSLVRQHFSGQRMVSIPTLVAICNELDITPNELLEPYIDSEVTESRFTQIIHMLGELEDDDLDYLATVMQDMIKYRS